MQRLLVFKPDDSPFSADSLLHVFQLEPGFENVQLNNSTDDAVEATFRQADGWSILRLSHDQKTISLSQNTEVTLRAAMILRRHFKEPLQIIDSDYSFDLMLSDYTSVEDLQSAMARAQTS
jgi:hypothetical protein